MPNIFAKFWRVAPYEVVEYMHMECINFASFEQICMAMWETIQEIAIVTMER